MPNELDFDNDFYEEYTDEKELALMDYLAECMEK